MGIDRNIYLGSFLVIDTAENLHELMLDKFKDEDLFCVVYGSNDIIPILIPNKKSQGGINIQENDAGIWEYPEKDFSQEDWKKIEAVLKEEGISYEEKSGLVIWYI